MAWGTALSLAVSISGFVALFWRFSVNYNRTRTETRQVLKSIRSLMESTNLLLGALTKQGMLSPEQVLAVVSPFQNLASGAVDNLLGTLKPTGNPISTEDLEEIRKDVKTVRELVAKKSVKLPMDKALDFYYKARLARNEHSDEPLFQEIVELAVFLVGSAGTLKDE